MPQLAQPSVSLSPAGAHDTRRLSRYLLPVLATVAMGVAGYFVGASIGRLLKSDPAFRGAAPWLLASLPVLLFSVLALHEAGHLLGGRLSGFQFLLFAVGPLRLERRGDSIRASFNRSLSLWGGIAASAPASGAPVDLAALRRGMIRVVAFGPFASLAGALLLPLSFALGALFPIASLLCGFFGATSLSIAAATLVPSTFSGFSSDGARLLQLLRNTPAGQRWAAIAALSSLGFSVRPSAWPRDLVLFSTSLNDDSPDAAAAAWFRHAFHLDLGEIDDARLWLHRTLGLLRRVSSAARPSIHATASWFLALHDQDPSSARHHYELANRPGFVEPSLLRLSEAAVLLAERRATEARAALAQAQALPGGPTAVARLMHHEMIDELRSRIDAL